MSAPVKVNFKIYQGSTFKEVLRWESSTKVYKPISGITKSAPVEINAIGHGAPTGWRVKITNVLGMKEINSADTYNTISEVTADGFKINAINAVSFSDYTSGGIVEYNQPVDLAGLTAKMQIREKLDSSTYILELTTENGGIVLDNINKTITINISYEQTAALSFSSAVYSLEIMRGAEVTPFINGTISLVKEVTR